MVERGGKRKSPPSPSPLSSILPSLSHLNLAAKLREYKVAKAWSECVGDAISKKAWPERLMGTTLYCNVANSAWTTELNYQKAGIMERLNESLGYKAVTEIILKIGPVRTRYKAPPVPPRQWKELTPEDNSFINGVTAGIKDDKLKALIKRVIGKSRS